MFPSNDAGNVQGDEPIVYMCETCQYELEGNLPISKSLYLDIKEVIRTGLATQMAVGAQRIPFRLDCPKCNATKGMKIIRRGKVQHDDNS